MTKLFEPRYIDGRKLWKVFDQAGFFYDRGDRDIAQEAVENAMLDGIDIIRCQNCKHGRPIDKTKFPEKYFRDDCIVCECEDVVGEESMIYINSHFCSYGEGK